MTESTSGVDMDQLPGFGVVTCTVAATASLGLASCDEGRHEAHLGSMSASQCHSFGVQIVFLS
jgi:hypothetical protein